MPSLGAELPQSSQPILDGNSSPRLLLQARVGTAPAGAGTARAMGMSPSWVPSFLRSREALQRGSSTSWSVPCPRGCFRDVLSSRDLAVGWGVGGGLSPSHPKSSPCPAPPPKAAGRRGGDASALLPFKEAFQNKIFFFLFVFNQK